MIQAMRATHLVCLLLSIVMPGEKRLEPGQLLCKALDVPIQNIAPHKPGPDAFAHDALLLNCA